MEHLLILAQQSRYSFIDMASTPEFYYKATQLVLNSHITPYIGRKFNNNIKILLLFESHKLSKNHGYTKHSGLSIKLNKCENSINNHLGFDE